MSQNQTSSLLRVLCLHDAGSNSAELSGKLHSLGNKLYQNHGIDLVFVDAPLSVELKDDENDEGNSDSQEQQIPRRMLQKVPPRAWWEEQPRSPGEGRPIESDEEENINPNASVDENNDLPQTPHYVGLDASLLLLRQVWTSSTFWGIMAFGQAAGVAALLPLLPTEGANEAMQPSFLIFVNGQSLLDEEELLTEHLRLPCLHVVDNPHISQEEPLPAIPRSNPTQRLVRQFGGTVVCDGSLASLSTAKRTSAVFHNHVGSFLVHQKRKLRKSRKDAAVLALRHQLQRTEADAAQLVAREIAQDPPDCLMAVITPKNVGGFSERRKGPAGGGAPCPSEFLLQRAKRSGTGETTTEGQTGREASREHPNQRPKSQEPTTEAAS